MKVTDTENGAVVDVSDASFTIAPASPRVTFPNGGKAWFAGTEHEIEWVANFIPSTVVTLSYSLDSGDDAALALNLYDGYGDGWNGNELTFFDVLGVSQASFTLPSGDEGQTEFCLPTGCYTYAAGGGAYLAEISWTLLLNSEEIASGEGGASGLVGVNAPCEEFLGCTDEGAFNFDPNALADDGSCTYPIFGCTDPSALNHDPAAEVDDGSCYYADDVLGCTDSGALNFNPLATYDDGTCAYPELSFEPLVSEVCLGDTVLVS